MRTAIAFLLVAVGSVSSGCSLCAPGYLCDYSGVGGKWQRTDPENGRVGSILSDPNSVVAANQQPAEVIGVDTYEYEDGTPSDDSILEPVMNDSAAADDGIVILGDRW